jgi:hypothetical protein
MNGEEELIETLDSFSAEAEELSDRINNLKMFIFYC